MVWGSVPLLYSLKTYGSNPKRCYFSAIWLFFLMIIIYKNVFIVKAQKNNSINFAFVTFASPLKRQSSRFLWFLTFFSKVVWSIMILKHLMCKLHAFTSYNLYPSPKCKNITSWKNYHPYSHSIRGPELFVI